MKPTLTLTLTLIEVEKESMRDLEKVCNELRLKNMVKGMDVDEGNIDAVAGGVTGGAAATSSGEMALLQKNNEILGQDYLSAMGMMGGLESKIKELEDLVVEPDM